MPFVNVYTGLPTVVTTEESFLSVILDLYPVATNSAFRELRARLYVDDVEIGVPKSLSYADSDRDIAGTLNVEIAKLADRSLFVRGASIKCTIEEKLAGVWTVIQTLVDGGLLASVTYEMEHDSDGLQIAVNPVLNQRLEETPLGHVVLYDPDKATVTADEIESIFDEDGTEYAPTLVPTSDLTVWSVMDYVADVCGFAGKQTNINDWELNERVDFPPGQPYWNALASIIGEHEPILTVDADDNLVIRDGTADLQPDTSGARDITVALVSRGGLTTNFERVRGRKVSYQEQDRGYDYWEFDVEHKEEWFQGTVGQYPKTESEIWLQKFYRNSNPNKPVNTRTLKEYHFVRSGASSVISATGTVFSYTNGQVTGRESREFGLIKAPQSWITYNATLPGPSYGFVAAFGGAEESYTSASDTTHSESLVLVKTEKETFRYAPHPFESDSMYQTYHETWTKGLITVDTENQQLADDFEQPYGQAQRAGNLAEGQGARWGTTEYREESTQITRDRKVRIKTRINDTSNSSGILTENYEDHRVGDVGIKTFTAVTKPLYVFEGGDSTANLIVEMQGGEAPESVWKPLAIRKNTRQGLGGQYVFEMPGVDTSLTKGRIIRPKDRSGTSFGVFLITGRTFSVSEGSPWRTEITARQIAPSSVEGDVLTETIGVSLESGESREFTREIYCNNGHELSLGVAVADVAVEFKHSAGAYVNAETTAIDLSTWAGTSQTFTFKFTAGAITSHLTRSFTFRIGPA